MLKNKLLNGIALNVVMTIKTRLKNVFIQGVLYGNTDKKKIKKYKNTRMIIGNNALIGLLKKNCKKKFKNKVE